MKPFISVIVISYNIERELPRTLVSLSPGYQLGMTAEDYEVILVDNGSKNPPLAEDFGHLGLDLTVLRCPDPTPSPVRAINMGLNASCGAIVGVFIDGARLASPGLLLRVREAISMESRSVVATRGRYLGPDLQRDSVTKGYTKEVEDRLLDSVNWTEDGYRLFDVSVFDESSGPTWFSPISESNGIFMTRTCWWELNGFEERFETPGGGLANLDLWRRAATLPDVRPTILLGEGTFHQLHGGVATNGSIAAIESLFEEYAHIRGCEYEKPDIRPHFFGWFASRPPTSEMVGKTEEHILRTGSVVPARPPRRSRTGILRFIEPITPSGIRRSRQEREWIAIVSGSQLFDEQWYLNTYPQVVGSGMSPATHFVREGVWEGLNPSADFDTLWYYGRYPDVMDAGMNALVHYVIAGRSEGRRPGPAKTIDAGAEERDADLVRESDLFDAEWYRTTYPDVMRQKTDPLVHFLRFGRGQARNPSAKFDTARYMRDNPDVELSRMNPLIHYLRHGRQEGRSIHAVGATDRS